MLQGKEVFHKGSEVSVMTRQVSQEWRVYVKLALWPLIFVGVWIIPTINRVQGLITKQVVFPLTFMHIVITNLHGFLNVLLYFFNPLDHTLVIRKLLCCEYCKQNQSEEEHKANDADEEMSNEEYGLMKK